MSIPRSSTSSPTLSPQWKYDVFLSFRGEDTRRGFTDNLYTALEDEGINTFRDDPELQKGEAIDPALFAAIKEARFAVIVLSQNYASSTWCLDELVNILECMKESGRVLPVFYDVDPYDVRKQTGSFGEAFATHEERFRDDNEKVQRWKSALNDVAKLAGWNSKEWYERDLIRAIVEDILEKLQLPTFSYVENLVGMDSRLQPVFSHLDVGVDDVRFIGIWGMGGIGKTIMARAVYERISHQFECSYLLINVRDFVEKGGLLNLQKQLLSGMMGREKADKISDIPEGATAIKRLLGRKNVLVILDDVNHSDQLEYLVGNPGWFGSGSRVLITTRNEHLLIQHEVERRLKVEELNHVDSLQLFSKKAFKKDYPEEDFLGLSESVVSYAKGLPLALKVLGSFLYGRDVSEWNSALSQLGRVCNSDIFDVLKISFDDLDSDEKKIFLDIACFFNGHHKVRVIEVLNCCDVAAIIGIKILIERSLVTLFDGKLWMHDLLREIGHRIVRLESPNEPGRRSRLWLHEDVKHVLTQNTGTEAMEGIFLDSTESGVEATPKSFSMMQKLRYLKIKNGDLPKGLEYLPNSLRILDWTRYPLKYLPANFNPWKLFELILCHSCIELLRIGTEPLYNLKTINLSHSLNFVSTPNFRVMPYLEFLYLEGCIRLYEIDTGIEVLERLIVLNLKDCQNLVRFPSNIGGLKSLKDLNLSGCSKLEKLPDELGHVACLEKLDVSGSGITKVPSSICLLNNLKELSLGGIKAESRTSWNMMLNPLQLLRKRSHIPAGLPLPCLYNLKTINLSHSLNLVSTPNFRAMPYLEFLYLEGCIRLHEIDTGIEVLERLSVLNLKDCQNLVRLPSNIGGLKSLKDLNLSGCTKLENLPDELGQIRCLGKLDVSGSGIREVPSFIGLLTNLNELSLAGYKAQSRTSWNMMLNPLRSSRKESHIPARLSLPCMSGLHSLTELDRSDCNLSVEAMPGDPGCLASLRHLRLRNNQCVRLLESIIQLSLLETPYLDECRKLQIVPKRPSDAWVSAYNCMSLDTLGNQIGQSTPKCLQKPTSKLFYAERLEIVDEGSTIMKGDNVDLDDTKTLTPSLKQLLFLYCSLFPLDYEFRKYELVQLWIAQGFIEESKKETMEDTGLSYFTAMEVEGYFVPSKHSFLLDFDSLFSVPIYNPSNFLYKVNATKISVLEKRNDGGNYFKAVNVGQLCEASELLTKHLSLKISESNDDMTFGVVQKFKNLQTLLLFSASVSTIKHVPRDLFLSLHELRTLNLSRALISGLPSSIGEARELRYLDVSYTPITQLPESVSSLHQLQTLKLRGCVHFSMLPRATKNLTNLRHIELDIILQLDSMPTYLGNLTNLQTLSAFLVGTDDGCRINELTNLNDLKGVLSVSGLENVVNKKEAEEAALMNKKYLQRLDLRWSNVIADEENRIVQNEEKRKNIDEEVILESLRPPYGLKELQIEHYAGLVLPTWISDPLFADLVVITLYGCKHCKLVPCLGQLPGLQSLSIIEMNAVEEINHDFFRNDRVDQSLQAFPKLEMLEVDIMLNLKDWTGVQIGDLPALHKLTVKSCPELVSIPSLSNLKSLKHLEFRRCAKLPSLPNDRLPTSLESFILKDCPQLEKSCINVKGEDWSKICCVPNVWFDDEEIITQGSSQKDSDNVVTPSLHDKIQPAADEELMQCLEILNNMEEIDDDSYSKAVKFFHGEIIWRKVFVHMAEKRRKGFILSL